MSEQLFELWIYLSARPLTGLTLTLVAFAAAEGVHRRLGQPPVFNPVLVSVVMIASLLYFTQTPYERYFDGAQFVHFLLGPATVLLAVPLYKNLRKVRRSARAVMVGLGAGCAAAIGTSGFLGRLFSADREILLSLAPKSVTTPVAMAVAEQIGGLPSLTAVLVILTGIVGAVLGGPVFDAASIRDPRARGLGYGLAAHGIGTARAFMESPTTGAFASLGMGLNALLTAWALPPLVAALGW